MMQHRTADKPKKNAMNTQTQHPRPSAQQTKAIRPKKVRVRLHRDGSIDVWHVSAERWKPCKPGAAASVAQSLSLKSSPTFTPANPVDQRNLNRYSSSQKEENQSLNSSPRGLLPRSPTDIRHNCSHQEERHVLHVGRKSAVHNSNVPRADSRRSTATHRQQFSTQQPRQDERRPTTRQGGNMNKGKYKPDYPAQLRLDVDTENNSNDSNSSREVTKTIKTTTKTSPGNTDLSWDVFGSDALVASSPVSNLSSQPSDIWKPIQPIQESNIPSSLYTNSSDSSADSNSSAMLWLATQPQTNPQQREETSPYDYEYARAIQTSTSEWRGGPPKANHAYRMMIAGQYFSTWHAETVLLRARRRLLGSVLVSQQIRTQKRAFGRLRSYAVAVHKKQVIRRTRLKSLLLRQTLRCGMNRWRVACGLLIKRGKMKRKDQRSVGETRGRDMSAYLRVLQRRQSRDRNVRSVSRPSVAHAPPSNGSIGNASSGGGIIGGRGYESVRNGSIGGGETGNICVSNTGNTSDGNGNADAGMKSRGSGSDCNGSFDVGGSNGFTQGDISIRRVGNGSIGEGCGREIGSSSIAKPQIVNHRRREGTDVDVSVEFGCRGQERVPHSLPAPVCDRQSNTRENSNVNSDVAAEFDRRDNIQAVPSLTASSFVRQSMPHSVVHQDEGSSGNKNEMPINHINAGLRHTAVDSHGQRASIEHTSLKITENIEYVDWSNDSLGDTQNDHESHVKRTMAHNESLLVKEQGLPPPSQANLHNIFRVFESNCDLVRRDARTHNNDMLRHEQHPASQYSAAPKQQQQKWQQEQQEQQQLQRHQRQQQVQQHEQQQQHQQQQQQHQQHQQLQHQPQQQQQQQQQHHQPQEHQRRQEQQQQHQLHQHQQQHQPPPQEQKQQHQQKQQKQQQQQQQQQQQRAGKQQQEETTYHEYDNGEVNPNNTYQPVEQHTNTKEVVQPTRCTFEVNIESLVNTLTHTQNRLSLRIGWYTLLTRLKISRAAHTLLRLSVSSAFVQWKTVVHDDIRNICIADRYFENCAKLRFFVLLRAYSEYTQTQRSAIERANAFRERTRRQAGLNALQRFINDRGVQRVNLEMAGMHYRYKRIHDVLSAFSAHRVRNRERRLHDTAATSHRENHVISNSLETWKINVRANIMIGRLITSANVRGRDSVLRSVLGRWKQFRIDGLFRRAKIKSMHVARVVRRKRHGLFSLHFGAHLEKCERAAVRQYTLTNCRRVLKQWHFAAKKRKEKQQRKADGEAWWRKRTKRSALTQMRTYVKKKNEFAEVAAAVSAFHSNAIKQTLLNKWRCRLALKMHVDTMYTTASTQIRKHILRTTFGRLKIAVSLALLRADQMATADEHYVESAKRRTVKTLQKHGRVTRNLAKRYRAVEYDTRQSTLSKCVKQWRVQRRRVEALSVLGERWILRHIWGKWMAHMRSRRLKQANMIIAVKHYRRRLKCKGISKWLSFAVSSAAQFERDTILYRGVVAQRSRGVLTLWRTRTTELELDHGQESLAVAHWRAQSLRQVMQKWKSVKNETKLERRIEQLGHEFESRRKLGALAAWMEAVVYIKKKRMLAPTVLIMWRNAKLKRAVSSWRCVADEVRVDKEQDREAIEHWANTKQERMFEIWRVQAVEARKMRQLEKMADMHWALRLQTKVLFGWMVFAVERAQEAHLRWERNLEVKRRMLLMWRGVVLDRRRSVESNGSIAYYSHSGREEGGGGGSGEQQHMRVLVESWDH